MHHPDKGGDAAQFKQIALAYEVLGDDKSRRRYDMECDRAEKAAALEEHETNMLMNNNSSLKDDELVNY